MFLPSTVIIDRQCPVDVEGVAQRSNEATRRLAKNRAACEKRPTLVSCNSVRRGGTRLMERIEKTAFLSYRRTNVPWALAIFQNLTFHGYDVFFDYNGIGSGDFERVILGNTKARAHFLVLLTPSALVRGCLGCPK
jgi:hypothetical protein